MLQVNQLVYVNHIIGRALFDSTNLPKCLRDTLTKLEKFGKNPARITSIKNKASSFLVTLKVEECYDSSSVPAVMSEAYNGGQNTSCVFETKEQADFIFTQENQVSFFNLSPNEIEGAELVRLVYNNKNLVIMPVGLITRVEDYHGVIGKSVSIIRQYETGIIQLFTVAQLMDNSNYLRLNIRGFRNL
jgi:hypothetical protein